MAIGDIISTKLDDDKNIVSTVETENGNNRQCENFSPAGDLNFPLKDDKCLTVPVSGSGKEVLVGILNKDFQVDGADIQKGERKIFARDENGNLKCYAYLKKNGDIILNSNASKVIFKLLNDGKVLLDAESDIEIKSDTKIKLMNGSDYAVRYNELKTQLDQLKQDLANQTHTFSVTLAPSGTYNGTTATGLPAPSSDFSNCKVSKINVPSKTED